MVNLHKSLLINQDAQVSFFHFFFLIPQGGALQNLCLPFTFSKIWLYTIYILFLLAFTLFFVYTLMPPIHHLFRIRLVFLMHQNICLHTFLRLCSSMQHIALPCHLVRHVIFCCMGLTNPNVCKIKIMILISCMWCMCDVIPNAWKCLSSLPKGCSNYLEWVRMAKSENYFSQSVCLVLNFYV